MQAQSNRTRNNKRKFSCIKTSDISIASFPKELLLQITGYVDIFSARRFAVCNRALHRDFLPVSASHCMDHNMLKSLLGSCYPIPEGVDIPHLVYLLACRSVLSMVIQENLSVRMSYKHRVFENVAIEGINFEGDSLGLVLRNDNLCDELTDIVPMECMKHMERVMRWKDGCV
jgi:hypothetical protein